MNNRINRAPVVIIGGGVAGLTAANLLTHNGFDVAIFEASDKLGGSCATTALGSYTFNDGAVSLALINVLDHAFARAGLNRAEQLPLRKIAARYSATMPDGTLVTLGEGLNLTVTGRVVDSKRVHVELRRMMDKWRPVLRFVGEEFLLHPFSSWRTLQKGWRHLPKLRGTVAAEFYRLFSDEAVRAALSGDLLYSGLPADAMPVSAILGLVAELDDGLYLPEGGMGQVPQVLSCALKSRRVRVSVNSKIDKITIKDGRVRGVEIGRDRVDAAAVISTASGMQTFGSLVEAQSLPSSIVRRLKRPRLSHRAVSIQLGLANTIDAPAHSVSVLPWMEQQRAIFLQDGREMKFPVYLVPTVTMPELAPGGGSIIEMFYPVRSDVPLEYWDQERKEQLTESAVAVLRRTYDLHVAATRVRSPKDFRDNMHLFHGALYGLSPASTPRDQFPHDPGIPGLFLAGQTTFPGFGVGPAMMSGIFAAEALLATA